ncbi:EF-hand calcium-binding domain-containing protein 11 isoform X1 [Alligator mississippiensis]|uniref:EF-hand calcium-binding domain-containing protein 11 isoform X1 n=1 Tax=Alligator mississippiensis TaxID=8496 RepID=UPI0028781544|nr:EF-hand calcium-binding domain-containing protein 11 isoform X1 [Alligator mississippiensis]
MCAASARAGDRERYARVFAACDEDSKGYLSREDFKVAVVMLFGYKPSKVEVNSVMASLQQKNSGVLLEEFLNLMTTKKSAQLYHSEIRQIFTAFDMQCRGFLTLEDFKKAFDSIAPKLPKRIIIEAFSSEYPPNLILKVTCTEECNEGMGKRSEECRDWPFLVTANSYKGKLILKTGD